MREGDAYGSRLSTFPYIPPCHSLCLSQSRSRAPQTTEGRQSGAVNLVKAGRLVDVNNPLPCLLSSLTTPNDGQMLEASKQPFPDIPVQTNILITDKSDRF